MITIIEPHGDDALISCYPLLMSDEQVRVVTLGNSRSSLGLEKHFKNVTTEYWDLYQISYFLVKPTYRDYSAWLKSSDKSIPNPWIWQHTFVRNQAAELWTESSDILKDAIVGIVDAFPAHSDVYLPVGLLHPYHILVSTMFERFSQFRPDVRFRYYSEAPYNSHKWARTIEESRPKGQLIQTSRELDYKHKEAVFRDVYPTEVKMYFAYSYDQVIKNEYRFYESK